MRIKKASAKDPKLGKVESQSDAMRKGSSRKPARLEVTAEDEKLIITLPRFDPPTRSSSGKSFLIATTGGVKRTSFLVNGLPVHVVASAFIYDDGGTSPVQWQPLFEMPKRNDDEDDEEWDEIEELA
jgi:hypothetical protein